MTCGCIVVLLAHPAREGRATRTTLGPSDRRQRRALAGSADRTCRRRDTDFDWAVLAQMLAGVGRFGNRLFLAYGVDQVRVTASTRSPRSVDITSGPGLGGRACGRVPCFLPRSDQGPPGFNCAFRPSTPGDLRVQPGTSEPWGPSLGLLCGR